MVSSSSSDDGDVPRGLPSLTGLTLHEHSPPPLPRRSGQRSSIFPSGLSDDVIPAFRNIALQEHSPSPLPHSEHRSSDFPAEPSSPTMSPVTEQSGNISDPDFSLPPPVHNHIRGNPASRRGHRRANSALHHGHSEQRSEQHDDTQLPTPHTAAGRHNPFGGITAPDWNSFKPAWQETTPGTSPVHLDRPRSAASEGEPPSPPSQPADAVMREDSLGQRQAYFRHFSREEHEGSGRRAYIYGRAALGTGSHCPALKLEMDMVPCPVPCLVPNIDSSLPASRAVAEGAAEIKIAAIQGERPTQASLGHFCVGSRTRACGGRRRLLNGLRSTASFRGKHALNDSLARNKRGQAGGRTLFELERRKRFKLEKVQKRERTRSTLRRRAYLPNAFAKYSTGIPVQYRGLKPWLREKKERVARSTPELREQLEGMRNFYSYIGSHLLCTLRIWQLAPPTVHGPNLVPWGWPFHQLSYLPAVADFPGRDQSAEEERNSGSQGRFAQSASTNVSPAGSPTAALKWATSVPRPCLRRRKPRSPVREAAKTTFNREVEIPDDDLRMKEGEFRAWIQ
ncbi:hypothetical protein C6P46_005586 [Rhodotorula mucilaginosa]|uniref:Uncharacterized protein n=1 Tax=Rhodotorula mucilaginosa TaxID=5537 RepID=A0A9P7B497_RHOMI|nr:hypothetical protein C6P46_005586 [Rhodotorula mucilaginosa]